MSMNLSELLNKGIIRKVDPDKSLAKELLALAERDLKTAADNLNANNHDWALAIAYNAMLSSGRALLAYRGYATSSENHHLGVVQFCAAVLPADSSGLVALFNRYRVRRHDVVYGAVKSVGSDEAGKATENAKMFVERIRQKMI